MRAWLSKLWVRNVIGAVVALAAVAVIVIFTGLSESWATYRHTVVPGAVVPAGQSGEAGGYTWKVAGTKYLNRSPNSYGPPLPAGTVLRVVTVERTGPPPEKVVCNGVITDGERRWKSEGVGGFSAPTGDGVTSLCSMPGLLQFTFLLPQDAVPTAMDIVAFDGAITVRLLL
jgi:hypothetical protein